MGKQKEVRLTEVVQTDISQLNGISVTINRGCSNRHRSTNSMDICEKKGSFKEVVLRGNKGLEESQKIERKTYPGKVVCI